jgi:hypothetical protein
MTELEKMPSAGGDLVGVNGPDQRERRASAEPTVF